MRILVVDDDPLVRETTRALLEVLGHDVAEARDGESGIAAAAEAEFDLCVLDVRLPRMRTSEVLAGLRGARPALAVLLCTGLQRDMLDASLLATPRVGYLEKPFLIADFEAAIEAVRAAR